MKVTDKRESVCGGGNEKKRFIKFNLWGKQGEEMTGLGQRGHVRYLEFVLFIK